MASMESPDSQSVSPPPPCMSFAPLQSPIRYVEQALDVNWGIPQNY